MRVAVIGVGAIGGPIAAHIAENAVDITAVTKHPELADLIKSKGIKLEGLETERYVSMRAVPSVDQLEGKFEVIFLAMKAMDVLDATKALLPLLNDDSVVVTLQNGVVEDDVAAIVGKNRVIGAVVVWASTMVSPGVIKRTADGLFFVGLLDESGNQKRLEEVAKLLKFSQPVTITDNIFGILYNKLGINAAINGVGAITGLTLGRMADNSQIRFLFMGIATEMIAVGNKLGIQIEEINKFHPQDIMLTGSDSLVDMEKKHKMIQAIFGPYKDVKASTLQSLERGQVSEIDYLNGYIARKGKEVGIPTPINSAITKIVKEIEAGKRKISPDNLLDVPLP
ncbi:MAG: ketopantoate reductase family protein [Candidatus Hermodarchaeota archaeon]